ncbi:MAG: peptidase pyroglutamyl peptidase, partial [Enterovirga sp.]|nr:peptidase pyroglutamyl peptidase [Enterovirga sp.]
MTVRLLVTGFGPFPTMPRNPSAALAAAVAGAAAWRRRGVAAECRILATTYAALGTELDPALATGPDAVLMIGVAGRSRRIRVERRATPRRSRLFPDASGATAARPERR